MNYRRRFDGGNSGFAVNGRLLNRRRFLTACFVVSMLSCSFTLFWRFGMLRQDELLPPPEGLELDRKSCASRYEYRSMLRALGKPSDYLVSKLRDYEARHRRCGPYTDVYNRTVRRLSRKDDSGASECRYVVSLPMYGIGNQMMGIASAFLYALLTDRVFLIGEGNNIADLFCEPFPQSSWLLPRDFPLAPMFAFQFAADSPDSLGNRLKLHGGGNLNNSSSKCNRPFLYIHLVDNFDDDDKRFFCDEEQRYVSQVPWLVVKSNLYFTPSLFMIPSMEEELHRLFPNKELVFHLVGHYLFHPSNVVWGLVRRYYRSYLSRSDVKVGIQIRNLHRETSPDPASHLFHQILPCSIDQGILPTPQEQEPELRRHPRRNDNTLVSVLITSLARGYYEELRKFFWENSTATGETVSVNQASFEEFQVTGVTAHDAKAVADIYLLSLSDKLVISPLSTFGYAAQGLSGKRSWILSWADRGEVRRSPACRRSVSIEPCYYNREYYSCDLRKSGGNGAFLNSYVRPCEDLEVGVKMVHNVTVFESNKSLNFLHLQD